jgi:hypothetical protein
MRKVKKWRYYCDFCKKSGASGGHIAKHERGCTRNPNRVCGLCAKAEHEQKPTAELLDALLAGGVPAVLELAGQCPACVVAAIHAYRADSPLTSTSEDYFEFDYKKAAAAFWSDVNAKEEPYY